MKIAVEKIVKGLVGAPDAVEVSEETTDRATIIRVRVAPDDMGRIIGRDGRTIKAVRSLLLYAGQKQGRRVVLDTVE